MTPAVDWALKANYLFILDIFYLAAEAYKLHLQLIRLLCFKHNYQVQL